MASINDKRDALLDESWKDYSSDPREILGAAGLLKVLTKRLVERALEGEMPHAGYAPPALVGRGRGNSRNGKGQKIVQCDAGHFEIKVLWDRDGPFRTQLVQERTACPALMTR